MDYASENHKSYIGRHVSELPTPSLMISLPILKQNIERLLKDVDKLGIGFRPHVKTLKCLEATKIMLGGGKHRGIVSSTLTEIKGALPLVKEGLLDSAVYCLPIYPSIVPRLIELRKSLQIILFVDNEQQVDILEKHGGEEAWDVFIKLDVGSRRAGVAAGSPALEQLVSRAEASSAVNIYGFYCHAGHSYGGRTRDEAETVLGVEIESVINAAKLLSSDREIIVSVGATPTAHVIQTLRSKMPANVKLELHAGNFLCNDLQQVSTGLVTEADQSVRVTAEICGVYPERNEALMNAGVIAMSKETSAYSGFGRVVGQREWAVLRLSQEHGILGTEDAALKVEDVFEVGQRINLYCNHTCITAAAFYVYFVVDEEDIVRETWVPWKGW